MKAAPEGVAMAIKLNRDISLNTVACNENGKPVASIPEAQVGEIIGNELQKAMAHQSKCKADATDFLQFYFNEDDSIELEFLESWLAKNQPLDRWFFVHLIEVAGQRFLDKSYSAHKAEIARSKNAVPRAFVLSAWADRSDRGQSKESFGKQFAPLVKKQFDLNVTSGTIARDWLPKGSK